MYLQIINSIASVIITLTSLCLLFGHYADKRSVLDKVLNRWQNIFFKYFLIMMSMGTLWNVFKDKPTPESEVLLNVGLSGFMIGLCIIMHRLFVAGIDAICTKDHTDSTINNDTEGYATIDPTDDPVPDDTEW